MPATLPVLGICAICTALVLRLIKASTPIDDPGFDDNSISGEAKAQIESDRNQREYQAAVDQLREHRKNCPVAQARKEQLK